MEETIKIDADLAFKHLKALAEEFPKKVYGSGDRENCVYFEEDDYQRHPSCIVGYVFDRMGVLDQLPPEVNADNVMTLVNGGFIEFVGDSNNQVALTFEQAQANQDADWFWGMAVERAIAAYGPEG